MLFVARREPPEMLDAVEEAFDAVACAVEHGTEARLPAAAGMFGTAPGNTSAFGIPGSRLWILPTRRTQLTRVALGQKPEICIAFPESSSTPSIAPATSAQFGRAAKQRDG